MRICLVYDCLFPWTVGGAERWYRSLAERLAAEGHEVSYVTMRQWPRGDAPAIPGVELVAAGPRMALYTRGRRRILPPLVFGVGVLWHLLRRGRRYDAVHTCAFPYFSLLAAAAARPVGRYRLVADWFEVWSPEYWTEYLGGVGGRIGLVVQRRCARVRQHAFCFSRLHRDRLVEEGVGSEPELLAGLYAGSLEPPAARPAQPVVLFAGRHIPEKRVPAIVPAIAAARREIPELRGLILGDGPARGEVLAAIARAGLEGVVDAPGFVAPEEVDAAMRSALCLVLPSVREGYGLVVVEASAHGLPSVVARAADNAAVELVEDGENGLVATSPSPEDLAAAIARVHAGGEELRERTREWFARNAQRLALETSLAQVSRAYARTPPA